MAFLPGLFGGDNVVGFFGGGRYRPDQQNFGIPDDQYGAMNFRMAEGGSGAAQDALGQYNPLAAADQTRQALNASLMGTLNGTGPSVAQQQLQNTTQGNVANAYAMGQSGRYNPGAARQVANNVGNINQQAAGQGALLRAQETQNAQGQLGALRGQDMGLYGLLNNTAQGYLGQQMQLQGMQQQGRQAYEQMNAQGFGNAQGNAVGGKILNAAGGVLGSMAGAGMFSPRPQPQGMAHGGQVMGDRACPGCGHLNSECICGSRHMAAGGAVDSLANDVVPIMASPGEVVLPRSVTMDKEAPDKAKAFVEAIRMARRKAA
jgi:hypothetical protein